MKTCTSCGTSMASAAPQGLCPLCLLKLGMTSWPEDEGLNQAHGSFVPPEPEKLAEFFPNLEIIALLGKGGMGAVYKAKQPSLDRTVALKILPPEVGRDPTFTERFSREARALAKLNHANIISVHDFGQTEDLYYLVMEYVDGLNLRRALLSGALSPKEAISIVPQICDALQYAHEKGVVHRDIKPENILLDARGHVKIADFGLAKLMGHGPDRANLTATGQVMGTPHYMAPEQIEHPLEVDHRADIYSLGVVFYEMLTHELPMGKFPPPSRKVQVDIRFDDVVLRALEKEPRLRYQHAQEVKTDVTAITQVPGGKPVPPAAGVSAAEQVKYPAFGILAAAMLNWITIPIIYYIAFGLKHIELIENTPPVVSIVVAVVMLILNGFIMFAAFKMRRLEKYRAAVAASVIAMIVTPGNLIGLPAGIWSLVALNDPAIKAAFAEKPKPQVSEQGSLSG